ncbi:hypothetical protein [Pontibacter sp. SGAir0037]|uniref:hypothetical protein n=1 Tax=Pontibacter sp. SGAir0037 TaxID=2571030 RepID=UPI0010CD2091|nr:hypothetical protein [Pontibacter sp. SGAir0037]QCR22542.1 hypothetical protein C1N53_09470 [Pontibacter sp. SGAir0037]
MENNSEKTLQSLVDEPAQVKEIMNDPTKGLDFYKKLPVKQKQYLLLAAAAGLVGYSIYLGKKG